MINAMLFILPCAVIGLASIYATVMICNASYVRELEVVKKALRSSQQSAVNGQQSANAKSEQNEKMLLGARLTILVLAVTFITIGIFNGGMADVLQKAINICTECIGLG